MAGDAVEDGRGADHVDELGPSISGRWLVASQGSRHVWDLDAMTYQRLPGAGSKRFDYDGEIVPISRVQAYPAVGGRSVVFFDDPQEPWMEQWRVCSIVRTITRLRQDDRDGITGVVE